VKLELGAIAGAAVVSSGGAAELDLGALVKLRPVSSGGRARRASSAWSASGGVAELELGSAGRVGRAGGVGLVARPSGYARGHRARGGAVEFELGAIGGALVELGQARPPGRGGGSAVGRRWVGGGW